MIETSSGLPGKSFVNLRKFSENVRERSSSRQNKFGKSSEIFGVVENLRKIIKNVVIRMSI